MLGSGSVTEAPMVACQVTPICSLKCPSLISNRPPPARCTIQASRMMTRMIRTIQITVTTKPGRANLPTLATVVTLADGLAYREGLAINVEGPKLVIGCRDRSSASATRNYRQEGRLLSGRGCQQALVVVLDGRAARRVRGHTRDVAACPCPLPHLA